LGLLVSIIYWGLLVAGQSLGLQYHNFSPFVAMWMPNFIILAFALFFLLLRMRR
jgi:lipopolysaccharide export system permease protein